MMKLIQGMKDNYLRDYTLGMIVALVSMFAVAAIGAFGALVIVGLAIARDAGYLIWLIPCAAAVVAALSVIIYVDPE